MIVRKPKDEEWRENLDAQKFGLCTVFHAPKMVGVVHSTPPTPTPGELPEKQSRPLLKPQGSAPNQDDRLVPWVCTFLAAMVWMVFGQTLGHGFVNIDDQIYVYENPIVAQGLTLRGIVWAFRHTHSFNWHPLTTISHMLDCSLYGLNAGGHHLTNVLLHTAAVILLFLVLRRMTGKLWQSAFVAAVFGVHPLRVESVAWVAERKDVLSGLFFMLTLWAYGRYAQKRSRDEGRESRAKTAAPALGPRPSTLAYRLVLLFFALGLMSKPMLVTVPLVLLLLDYWPLQRVTGDGWRVTGEKKERPSTLNPQLSTLFFEKLPLMGMAVVSAVVTLYAQRGALQTLEEIPLPLRVGNAMISYVAYMGQMLWPSGLAALYPFAAGEVEAWRVVGSLVLVAGISAGVFVLRRHRYLVTGWLWYVMMLVPVIGLVQVGIQSRADRYTYLPEIGLYMMVTWGVAEWCAGWRYRRVVLGGGASLILVALIFCARVQTSYWRDNETLWTHTLACTSDNAMVENVLGAELRSKGSVGEAINHLKKALEIKPDYADAHINLANILLQQGKLNEAITHFQWVLQIIPDYPEVHNNLGSALLQKGRVDEAMAHCRKALQLKPDYADPHINLGNALLQQGKVDEAIAHYQTALQLKPDSAAGGNNFDYALRLKGRAEEAMASCRAALKTNPDSPEALNNLAWLLATCPDARIRDGAQAVKHAGRACELTHYGVTTFVGTLAAADAEAGRFDEAIAAAEKACVLAEAAGETNLLAKNREQLALYRTHQPYHETGEKFLSATP